VGKFEGDGHGFSLGCDWLKRW